MNRYSLFAFYLLIGESLVRTLGFIVNVYLARILEPAGFGLIAIGTSFLTGSVLISEMGFRTLGLVETAKPSDEKTFSFSDILLNRVFHTLVSFGILYGLIFLLYKDPKIQTICTLFLINIFYDALFLEWYYNGLQRFKTIVMARICATLLYVGSVFFLVNSPDGVNSVPVLFFSANMIGVIILFLLLPSTSCSFKWVFSLKRYYIILTHALPLGIGTFLNQVTVYLPPLILGKFYTVREAGLYGAAMKIVLLIMALDKIFSTIYLSSLPRLWSHYREDTKKNLQTLLHLTMAICFLVSLIFSITSRTAITLVFGTTYIDSSPVLSIISWFFALTMINSIFVYGLIAIDQKILYLKATAIGFIINTILIIVCIYRYGIFGAGTAIVCGELIFIILCHQAFKKYSSLTFYMPFIKTVTASAAAYYIAVNLKFHIAVQSLIAALLFAALVLVFQIITKNDITVLLTKWNKS